MLKNVFCKTSAYVVLFALILSILTMTSCSGRDIPEPRRTVKRTPSLAEITQAGIPFQTAKIGDVKGSKRLAFDRSTIMIATEDTELDSIIYHVTQSKISGVGQRAALGLINLNENFVVAVFLGLATPLNFPDPAIEIIQVRQIENEIQLIARIRRNDPENKALPEKRVPYQVIIISKSAMLRIGDIGFILLDSEGNELCRKFHFVPPKARPTATPTRMRTPTLPYPLPTNAYTAPSPVYSYPYPSVD